MNIFEKFNNWKSDRAELVKENKSIRSGKLKVEIKFNELLEELGEVNKKYTSLLEEKSEQFNLYIKYQSQCEELAKEKREMKKQIAELNELIKQKDEEIQNIQKKAKKINNAKSIK